MDAQDMTDELAQILIIEEEIAARLDEMAAQIDADYEGDPLRLQKGDQLSVIIVAAPLVCFCVDFMAKIQ